MPFSWLTSIVQSVVNAVLHDHGGMVFDVVAYGADNSGATDTHTAINNALTAASVVGGVVFFPHGTYLTTQPIAIPSNVTIEAYGAIIKAANGATAINGIGVVSLTSVSNVIIRGLTIDGNKLNQTVSGFGITVVTSTNVTLEDMVVQNTPHIGIYYQQGANYRGARLTANNSGSLAIVPGGSEGIHLEQTVNCRLTDCVSSGSSGHGFYLPGGSDNVLIAPNSNTNGKRGIYATSPYTQIFQSVVQNNGWTGIELDVLSSGQPGDYLVVGGDVSGNGTATPFVEGDGLIFSAPRSMAIGVRSRNNGTNAGSVAEGHGIAANGGGASGAKGCQFIGCEAEGNGGAGFFVFMTDSTLIEGGVSRNNGTSASSPDPYGVCLADNGTTPCTNTRVSNLRCYDDGTGTQTYGAVLKSGAAGINHNTFVHCDFTGNATGTHSDSSGGTGNYFENCLPEYVFNGQTITISGVLTAGSVVGGQTATNGTVSASSDTTMTSANTLYDGVLTGVLADGTYLFIGSISVSGAVGAITARLIVSTTVVAEGELYLGVAADTVTITLAAIVTSTGGPIIKISALSSVTGNTIKAQVVQNGSVNKATQLTYVKLA